MQALIPVTTSVAYAHDGGDDELGMDSDDADGATDVILRAAEHGNKVLVVLHRVELCKKIHDDLN